MNRYKNILYLDNTETIYTRAIRDELKNHADKVDCFFYDEIYSPPVFYRKFASSKMQLTRDEKISEFNEFIKNRNYDFILVKEPFYLPISFFQDLKCNYPNIPIINYNWSSIKKDNFLPYQELFSRVYSFDYNDCNQHNLQYYPLFYLKDFEEIRKNPMNKKYKLSFIGSGYSQGRMEFLEALVKKERKNLDNISLYIHTPNKYLSFKECLKHPSLSKYFYWYPIHLNGVLNIFNQSHSAIDHPMSIQTGLTIRTFEAIAAGLHLYTTNKKIVSEPFYSSSKITVIQEDLSDFSMDNSINMQGDLNYFDSFQQYRIDNWVKRIIKV